MSSNASRDIHATNVSQALRKFPVLPCPWSFPSSFCLSSRHDKCLSSNRGRPISLMCSSRDLLSTSLSPLVVIWRRACSVLSLVSSSFPCSKTHSSRRIFVRSGLAGIVRSPRSCIESSSVERTPTFVTPRTRRRTRRASGKMDQLVLRNSNPNPMRDSSKSPCRQF